MTTAVADLGAVLRNVTSALATSLPSSLRIVTESRRMTLVRSEEPALTALLEAVATRAACRADGTEGAPAELLIAATTHADAVDVVVRVVPVVPGCTDPLTPELRAAAASQGVPMRTRMADGALELSLAISLLRPATPAARVGQKQRVAVIDDEELVGRSIERILVSGFDVQRFTQARDALDAIAGGARYALILCDLMMPEMTGMTFHDTLREVAPEQATRCCWMTGGAFTPSAVSFLKGREAATIEKPFMPSALRAWVASRIERMAAAESA
ncbi:MAG: response regulator [Polyangiales bacterium]